MDKILEQGNTLKPDYYKYRGGDVFDMVNHPSHYTDGKIEVIDFIEDKKLGYHLGNACKYITRCRLKNDGRDKVQDLRKAIWYIERQIYLWEGEER